MDLSTIGMGGVIRDERGKFFRAMCKQKKGAWSPPEAEALSLREVLPWLKYYGFTRCLFETDSKQLADTCNGNPERSYLQCLSTLKMC